MAIDCHRFEIKNRVKLSKRLQTTTNAAAYAMNSNAYVFFLDTRSVFTVHNETSIARISLTLMFYL